MPQIPTFDILMWWEYYNCDYFVWEKFMAPIFAKLNVEMFVGKSRCLPKSGAPERCFIKTGLD
jgi:hypothetical protein